MKVAVQPPLPVIVGVPRSGTTLLRMMMDSHSRLAIPPETGFLLLPEIARLSADPAAAARAITCFPPNAPSWPDFGLDRDMFVQAAEQLGADASLGDVLRLFYSLYARSHGKDRAGDKTPYYLTCMAAVAEILPEARFIHIIRDGRDVALSWQKMWFAPTHDVHGLIDIWADMVTESREAAAGLAYLEVSYSALLRDPAGVLQAICKFIDLEYEPTMLTYFQRSGERLREHRGRWRPDGTLVVSREERLQQQRNTMEPLILSRDGAWQRAGSFDRAALSAKARLLLDEVEQSGKGHL